MIIQTVPFAAHQLPDIHELSEAVLTGFSAAETQLILHVKGLIMTNEKGETTMQGIFASGDVVTGARTVVEAVKYSKMIADAMDEYAKKLKFSII